jgi:hypothetical protein
MINELLKQFGLASEQTVPATIYLLLSDNPSSAQITSITDTITQAGYWLSIVAAPQVLMVDGDTKARETLSGLLSSGAVLAIGVDDLSALLAAATSPELTAQLTALQSTTTSALNAAELTRPYAGEDWRGMCTPEAQ